MGLSAPRFDYLGIIALQLVKQFWGINPMVLISTRADSLDIIALHLVKQFRGINPMFIGSPKSNY